MTTGISGAAAEKIPQKKGSDGSPLLLGDVTNILTACHLQTSPKSQHVYFLLFITCELRTSAAAKPASATAEGGMCKSTHQTQTIVIIFLLTVQVCQAPFARVKYGRVCLLGKSTSQKYRRRVE